MGNVLSAVLQLKAAETAQAQQASDNLTQAMQIFQNARQNAQANKLAQLQAAQQAKYQDATIANQGIDNARQREQLDLQKPLWQSQTEGNIVDNLIKKSNAEIAAKNQALLYEKYKKEQSGVQSPISSTINNIMQPQQQSVSQNPDVIGLPGMGGSALGVGQPPKPQQAPSAPTSPIEGLTMPPKFNTIENDNGVLKEIKLSDDQQKYNTVYDSWQKDGKLGKGDLTWLSNKFNQNKDINLSERKDQFDQKRIQAMGDDLDPDKNVRNAYGIAQIGLDRSNRLEGLLSRYPDMNLTKQETEEVAIGLNSMLQGSNISAQEQVKGLIPNTIRGNVAKMQEWLFNTPQGLNQQEIIKRMYSNIQREKEVFKLQVYDKARAKLAKYGDVEKNNPEAWANILQSRGIDPEEYKQWKDGGYKTKDIIERLNSKSNNDANAPFQVGQLYNGEKIKSVKRIK